MVLILTRFNMHIEHLNLTYRIIVHVNMRTISFLSAQLMLSDIRYLKNKIKHVDSLFRSCCFLMYEDIILATPFFLFSAFFELCMCIYIVCMHEW